jgi:hypothetical protein
VVSATFRPTTPFLLDWGSVPLVEWVTLWGMRRRTDDRRGSHGHADNGEKGEDGRELHFGVRVWAWSVRDENVC